MLAEVGEEGENTYVQMKVNWMRLSLHREGMALSTGQSVGITMVLQRSSEHRLEKERRWLCTELYRASTICVS